MSFDLTAACQKALEWAKKEAVDRQHGEISEAHMLFGLLADPSGLPPQVRKKAGASAEALAAALSEHLDKLPSQSPAPADPGPSSGMRPVLNAAQQQKAKQEDSYLSVDHVLAPVEKILQRLGVKKGRFAKVVKEVRGKKKVGSEFAEATFEGTIEGTFEPRGPPYAPPSPGAPTGSPTGGAYLRSPVASPRPGWPRSTSPRPAPLLPLPAPPPRGRPASPLPAAAVRLLTPRATPPPLPTSCPGSPPRVRRRRAAVTAASPRALRPRRPARGRAGAPTAAEQPRCWSPAAAPRRQCPQASRRRPRSTAPPTFRRSLSPTPCGAEQRGPSSSPGMTDSGPSRHPSSSPEPASAAAASATPSEPRLRLGRQLAEDAAALRGAVTGAASVATGGVDASRLHGLLSARERDCEALQSQLQAEREATAKLRRVLRERTGRLNEAELQGATLEADMQEDVRSGLAADGSRMRAEIGTLREELAAASAQKLAARDEAERLARELSDSQGHLHRLRTEATARDTAAEEAKSAAAQLSALLDEETQRSAELRMRLDESTAALCRRIDHWRSHAAGVSRCIAALRGRAETTEGAITLRQCWGRLLLRALQRRVWAERASLLAPEKESPPPQPAAPRAEEQLAAAVARAAELEQALADARREAEEAAYERNVLQKRMDELGSRLSHRCAAISEAIALRARLQLLRTAYRALARHHLLRAHRRHQSRAAVGLLRGGGRATKATAWARWAGFLASRQRAAAAETASKLHRDIRELTERGAELSRKVDNGQAELRRELREAQEECERLRARAAELDQTRKALEQERGDILRQCQEGERELDRVRGEANQVCGILRPVHDALNMVWEAGRLFSCQRQELIRAFGRAGQGRAPQPRELLRRMSEVHNAHVAARRALTGAISQLPIPTGIVGPQFWPQYCSDEDSKVWGILNDISHRRQVLTSWLPWVDVLKQLETQYAGTDFFEHRLRMGQMLRMADRLLSAFEAAQPVEPEKSGVVLLMALGMAGVQEDNSRPVSEQLAGAWHLIKGLTARVAEPIVQAVEYGLTTAPEPVHRLRRRLNRLPHGQWFQGRQVSDLLPYLARMMWWHAFLLGPNILQYWNDADGRSGRSHSRPLRLEGIRGGGSKAVQQAQYANKVVLPAISLIAPLAGQLKELVHNVTNIAEGLPPPVRTRVPIAVTAAPIATTGAPIATTGAPIATTGAPIATTGAPIATTGAPIATTGAPIATTGAPIATTGAPAAVTDALGAATYAPASAVGPADRHQVAHAPRRGGGDGRRLGAEPRQRRPPRSPQRRPRPAAAPGPDPPYAARPPGS